jgi:3-oxoacyl-[acyl-carrier-protein] synthase-1
MAQRVFVTGSGIVSAIGNNVAEALDSLMNRRSGVGKITRMETSYRDSIPVAEVKYSNEELLAACGLKNGGTYTRTGLLGMLAAREALQSAGLDPKAQRTALLSATSVGGMDRSELFYDTFFTDRSKGKLRDVASHDCGSSTEQIAAFIGAQHMVSTISTACSSSANSIMLGARLIKNGLADCVIAGGTDSLTRFTLNGFNTLMILDREHCKPFDENRLGLNLGEGAGFIVLESEKMIKKSGKKILCELTGYANANDAFHQTASSPEGTGAFLAMSGAIAMSGRELSDISYINVHGTGTSNNDLSEGIAIERLFGENVPLYSSTKPYTGHTLGAAGGVEAVFSVLSIMHGIAWPLLNWHTQMKELKSTPLTELKQGMDIQNVLSNSFGFGGNNSSLLFSKV